MKDRLANKGAEDKIIRKLNPQRYLRYKEVDEGLLRLPYYFVGCTMRQVNLGLLPFPYFIIPSPLILKCLLFLFLHSQPRQETKRPSRRQR